MCCTFVQPVHKAVLRPSCPPLHCPPAPCPRALLHNSASPGGGGGGPNTSPLPSDFIVAKHESLQKEILIWAVFGTQTFGLLGSRTPPPPEGELCPPATGHPRRSGARHCSGLGCSDTHGAEPPYPEPDKQESPED